MAIKVKEQIIDMILALTEDVTTDEIMSEIIESLPIYQQNTLKENIKVARDDFNSKKVQKGSVDDLMRTIISDKTFCV